MINSRPKVFGIGLSKTGTSSLAQALQILGFAVKDNMGVTRYAAGELSSIDMETVMAHDALTDTPIPSFYRELDAAFQGSKFVLTVRDREGWLKSCSKQFSEKLAAVRHPAQRQLFDDLYGTNVFDPQRFADGYERFIAGVLEYFKSRPRDLLVMNVTAGDGWEKLCPFLGRPVPDVPFPKTNVTEIQWIRIEDIASVAEAAGLALMERFEGSRDAASRIESPRAARRFLDRAMQSVLGRDVTEAAAQAAHKLLVAGLGKLNNRIPVLSPRDTLPAHSVRRQWHHAWLVDPLDGKRAFADGRRDFSVNVALVEDGRPIFGVVHAPALGSTFYARSDRGVFKRTPGREGVRVAPNTRGRLADEGVTNAGDQDSSSIALAMCGLLDGVPDVVRVPAATEWTVAAAHAVLSAARLSVRDAESGAEPAYNTSSMQTPPLMVGARLES